MRVVPSGPPEQLNVSTTSSSTLQLQWNPPSLSSVNGIVQHYIITVYELATDTIFQSTTSTSTQLSVSGLHPYYIYTCSISAVTIGSGPVMNITIQARLSRKAKKKQAVHDEQVCYYTYT